MPGMFGVIGADEYNSKSVVDRFIVAGEHAVVMETDRAVTGATAHFPNCGITRDGPTVVMVDGEASIYPYIEAGNVRDLFRLDSNEIQLHSHCRGNVAVWDPVRRQLFIGTEWTATFPVYYARAEREGFMFSSRLRPLAATLGSVPDPLGFGQFLRSAFYLADRTQWSGICRLQPGQALRYDAATGRISITEHSQLWAGQVALAPSRADLAEQGWHAIGSAIELDSSFGRDYMIMSSGGWDSRTVLARTRSVCHPERLMGYSHGDPLSREIRIAQRLVGEAGIAFHQEPIDSRSLDLRLIQDGFSREEHAIFPYWMRAGQFARLMGNRVVTSGLFGEIMGGHYGRGMLLTGVRQTTEVARALLGSRSPSSDATVGEIAEITEFLSVDVVERPWVIREDWWKAANVSLDAWRADVTADVSRLRSRGVSTVSQLIEAFVAEHRGTQYGNAQIRAARTATDVAVPLAAREVLEWTTRLPLNLKIHNRANQAILRRYSPALLNFPMAATLASARRPLLVQEASRFARKGIEFSRRHVHAVTRRGATSPRLSWVNFDFLRSGDALSSIVNDLDGEMWDKGAMRRHIAIVTDGGNVSSHSTIDHFLKVYTLDLGLRCR